MTQTNNNFIMLPTVDFCFKELMQNEKVRKGFIAALLGRMPEEIQETTLLPTILRWVSWMWQYFSRTAPRLIWKCRSYISHTGQTGFYFIWENCIPDRLKKETPTKS